LPCEIAKKSEDAMIAVWRLREHRRCL